MDIKKLITSTLIMISIFTSQIYATTNKDTKLTKEEKNFIEELDSKYAYKQIKHLSKDKRLRIFKTKKERDKAIYIFEEFEKLGYDVKLQEFTYKFAGINKESINVIATKKPKNHKGEIVHVTAHYDSVPEVVGANDNLSGVGSMLAIAKAIEDVDINKEIRFIACGDEEYGLKGSTHYVNNLSDKEMENSIANFNLDMVATNYPPCSELAVYTNNGEENFVTDIVKESGEKLDIYSTKSVDYDGEHDGKMGSSDHVPFDENNIDSALFINVDPNKKEYPRKALEPYYHQVEDNIKNISKERLKRSIDLVGLSVYNALIN